MLYADDLCIASLSSAGLQQLLTICDQYCAMHSTTFNVKKSVCMFFRCSMNKTCDITNVVLSGNSIDYVHKTKYLGVLLCSDMKTSTGVMLNFFTGWPIGPAKIQFGWPAVNFTGPRYFRRARTL